MRLGPGKHLKGLTLFNGLVKPEEVRTILLLRRISAQYRPFSVSSTTSMRYVDATSHVLAVFSTSGQLIVTQEVVRTGARGYADGIAAPSLLLLRP